MIDMTDAEYVGSTVQAQLHRVSLETFAEDDDETIFNVIILEKDKDSENGE